MTLFRTVLVTSGLLALCGGVAQSAQNASANRPMMTLQMPATPEPARVTLNPRTTALMVLDYVEDICAAQPSCRGKMLPAMTPFMERAPRQRYPFFRSRPPARHPRPTPLPGTTKPISSSSAGGAPGYPLPFARATSVNR